jgi:hypothetical protein
MKKYYSVFIVLFAATVMLSCKKNDPAKEKDYAASIKDKTWWGRLTNAGETSQYYCVHFNIDKTLTWSQLSGDYTGSWSLSGNKITLNFPSPAVIVTADITDDNKLANITSSTVNKINSGEQVVTSNLILDNTVWKGTETTVSGNSVSLQMNFMPGNQIKLIQNNINYGAMGYSRSQSNGAIRFRMGAGSFPFFGFNISDTEMRGTFADYRFSWQLTKQ